MNRPLEARPAPGTTELLEVLDRALGGGIVIDPVPARDAAAPAAPANGAQIVVAALQTYLEHPDPALSRPAGPALAPAASPPKRQEVEAMTATAVEPRQVLIVEDDKDSREVYQEILETNGFDVETATSGPEGLRLAQDLHPGAVILDISIPELDGWAVASSLKADPATRDILVIIVTAYAFPEDRTRATDIGCEGFLTKPCEPSRVLAEVQRLLGTPGSP